jgi:threonine dehydratase
MRSQSPGLNLSLIQQAHARIADKINLTQVLTSSTLDAASGARLFFKCENFQKGGAFKARGACNAVFSLSDSEASRGVATHSSGNHAAALAHAARLRGIAAHIVMPEGTAQPKRAAVERYGATITWCAPTLAAREQAAAEVIAATGATLVHPYNDLNVMAGQGTTGIELLTQVADLDLVLCPVGGGGLIAGVAVAARALRPGIRVIGVEPAGADDAARSFRAGKLFPSLKPDTIADGLRGALGEYPFAEIRRYVEDIVTVPDSAIVAAMRRLWEVAKIVVEPSGAVPYAAIDAGRLDVQGKRVGIVLSGGNVDLEQLPWMRSATPARG